MTYNENPSPPLTAQKLHEAISLIVSSPKYRDIPTHFELSPDTERKLRTKLSAVLYNPPSPNSILCGYMGMPVIVDTNLPDDVIVFVYKTPQGERRELKVINLE